MNRLETNNQNNVVSMDSYRSRHESKRYSALTWATIGLLAVVGASEVRHKLTMPPTRTVPERVLPQDYENPSIIAQRAEQEAGKDPGDFNVHQEALRLADKYGQLYTGEQIKVQVR